MEYSLLQKILFQFDAERTHNFSLKTLSLLKKYNINLFSAKTLSAPCSLMGLSLPNPVGLAAGLDKNGEHIDALAAFGFGFIEVGTVTPKPQDGNLRPRLFRAEQQQAIVNRMGFNNLGIDNLIQNIKKANYDGVLGINIGKNATTPIENAVDDYLICLTKAYEYASYITVNISSPNTKNLRDLQQSDELEKLLSAIKEKQLQLANDSSRYVPVAVKIAPDLEDEQIVDIANIVRGLKIDGVIATNTTIDKSCLGDNPLAQENGGLSGRPLKDKSTLILQKLAHHLNHNQEKQIPIIGVGGIMSGDDAVDKFRNGATAVQLYSGLIYTGPDLVHDCVLSYVDYKKSSSSN